MMNLDWSFYNWALIQDFVLKGLGFSLMQIGRAHV